ncbi:hypothetical protein Tco_1556696 [Tanacetum coccineum]
MMQTKKTQIGLTEEQLKTLMPTAHNHWTLALTTSIAWSQPVHEILSNFMMMDLEERIDLKVNMALAKLEGKKVLSENWKGRYH